jgi:large subunit ribosomal protein L22
MDYKAIHRYADQGARKIRPFADLIRGRNADEALELLRFYHNRGARLVEKVVKSALGNADDRECPDLDALVVSEARVDEAPMFKRIQPRARGTAFPIKRRMSHIHITLSDPPEEPAGSPAGGAAGGQTPPAV